MRIKSFLNSITFLLAVALMLASTPAAADQAARRSALMSEPTSAQVEAAISQYQEVDPSARFTFFRGHVDAFATEPRATIPAYAQEVLGEAGVSINPVEPAKASTKSVATP